MNKPELIETLTSRLGIPDAEHKHFFEMLLKRCSEVLEENESLNTTFGRFEIRKHFGETEPTRIVFITNENEELSFDIPDKEEENFSIDSFFSLSIGKPVIPHPDSNEDEFFIPHSDSEMKRLMELKVDRFIEEHTGKEHDLSEHEEDISGVQFSFLNWKKTSAFNKDIEENIKNLEEDLASDFIEDEDVETPVINNDVEPEIENIANESDEISGEEIPLPAESEEVKEETFEEIGSHEQIENIENEFIPGAEEPEEIKTDSFEEKIDELLSEIKDDELVINEEPTGDSIPGITGKEISNISVDEKAIVENDLARISEAFKFAEEKKARLDGYKKRSYAGGIFAAIILVIIAAVIYYSYYFSGSNGSITADQIRPKKFNTVVERSYDIPVTYPYDSVMSADVYNAINDKTIFQKPDVPLSQQKDIDSTGIAGEIEIRNPIPAKRIKGYIYQYDDGMIAVQVSSWKAKSLAILETQKYLKAGYNAFIEQTELSGGIYYRVRVGSFKSVSEAEEFLK